MYTCRVLASRYVAEIRTMTGTQHSHESDEPACGSGPTTDGCYHSRMLHRIQIGQPSFWGGGPAAVL
eukprot:2616294-Prymnesium_polylepis.1